MFKKVDDGLYVTGQIEPIDVAEAVELGVTMVINNRPEGESGDQPAGPSIATAARVAGLEYRAIPVTPGRFDPEQVDAMAAALQDARGPVLAFCRSGTRSILLWALARTRTGDDPHRLAEAAAAAGYDLGPIAPLLAQVAANRQLNDER